MKAIFLLLFIIPSTWAFTRKPLVPTRVVFAVSEFSHRETGEKTVYRATVFYGGEEGAMSLGLEKYKIGEYGSPDKVLVQKKFLVPDLTGFQPFMEGIRKKSVEATYGCCQPPSRLFATAPSPDQLQ